MKQIMIAFGMLFCISVQSQVLPKNFNDLTKQVEPNLIEWRHHFHEFPELSNREFNTGKYIADYLKSIGLEVRYPVAKTGVVVKKVGSCSASAYPIILAAGFKLFFWT